MVASFTWIDWIIFITIGFFAVRGWTEGILHLISNLLSFVLSLYLAIRLQPIARPFLVHGLNISMAWAGVIAYVGIAFITESVLSIGFYRVIHFLPKQVKEGIASQMLGAIVSVGNGVLIMTFILVLIMALPVKGIVKQNISQSTIPPILLRLADTYGGNVKPLIENSAEELIQFMTVKPESSESIHLDVNPQHSDLHVNTADEEQMVTFVNQERVSRGIQPLTVDPEIRTVAREYSKEMFTGKFFSHYDPEGHDAGYRLQHARISFFVAGENIAFAPSVTVAHRGLMNSEGHRRNILDSAFHRVGIGVIDGGIWGKMFSQEFTD
jgi:uncharacterized protein YkwD